MCSIGDDNFDDTENSAKYMPEKPSVTSFAEQKCNKCREEKSCVLLRSKDKYCKSCFLSGTTHKFKGILGKHRLIRPQDRVLILHKGGHASTSLVHFVKTGLDLENFKRLKFVPVVLYIDEHFHLSVQERNNVSKNIESEAKSYDFPVYFASLLDILRSADKNVSDLLKTKSESLDITANDENEMSRILGKHLSKTNAVDYLQTLRCQFLRDAATYLECKFVFTPEISVDIAANLLSNISLGRGSHISLDTGFCDSRDSQVKILRPLRNFDSKELALYNHFNDLQPITFKQEQDVLEKNGGSNKKQMTAQNLIRKFVNDLQSSYPATITTVLKTGDKLLSCSSNHHQDGQMEQVQTGEEKCALCKAPLSKSENNILNASESTSFSHWVSTQGCHVSTGSDKDFDDDSNSCHETYEQTLRSFENVKFERYCYACSKFQEFLIK